MNREGKCMRLPYRISSVPQALYRAGINYYKTGVLFDNGIPMFDYYVCTSLTEDQVNIIRNYCEDVQLKTTGPMYAPEQKMPTLFFPKTAWYVQGRRKIQ